MTVSVRAIRRNVKAVTAEEEAMALESKLQDCATLGRLTHLFPSGQQEDHFLAIFESD